MHTSIHTCIPRYIDACRHIYIDKYIHAHKIHLHIRTALHFGLYIIFPYDALYSTLIGYRLWSPQLVSWLFPFQQLYRRFGEQRDWDQAENLVQTLTSKPDQDPLLGQSKKYWSVVTVPEGLGVWYAYWHLLLPLVLSLMLVVIEGKVRYACCLKGLICNSQRLVRSICLDLLG